MKWLHENQEDGYTTAAMGNAVAFGNMTVVQWLHNNREGGYTTNAMDHAALAALGTTAWVATT
ncbi:hypothetical protein L915_11457, partial [Phytophthora nicotianae]